VGLDGRPLLAVHFVLLFPGQGSQMPGMGKDLAAEFPVARAVFETVDAALGENLSALCFEGPAEELTRTHNAQPALMAHGAAVWAVTRDALSGRVRAAAGHSLGEFTAYHAAGALTAADAAKLLRRRGELMHASGLKSPGTMAAILGETNEPIEAICEQASAGGGVVVAANYNTPGQVVISGDVGSVERAMAMAKEAGAKRAVRLNVSGAFHSPLMESASDGLAEALSGASFSDCEFPVYANVNALPVTKASVARALLLEQLTRPVRWSAEVSAMAAAYPDATYVEMGPGTVLTGLVRKIAPRVRTMNCGTARDVHKLITEAAA
jgi:[acyl-carrier-protein] S-malonyltransferase